MNKEKLYIKCLKEKGYDSTTVDRIFQNLVVSDSKVDIFQIKSSIIFLSNRIEELDDLVQQANIDSWQIMNWAQVKSDRT